MAEPRLHAGLAPERWHAMSLHQQMGNIGSEVGRALRAHENGEMDRLDRALDRALELFELTLSAQAIKGRRKEICRAREVLLDYLVGDNEHASSAASLDAYFMHFATAASPVTRLIGDGRSNKLTTP